MLNEVHSFPVTENNSVEFYFDGESYQQLYLDLIDKAQDNIILQTYIFELDQFGKSVFSRLINAAKRGVNVYLLVDDFGTSDLGVIHMRELRDYGVFFSRFNKVSLFNIKHWGRRLHHKVLIVDGRKSIVGGINVISFVNKNHLVPRLDFALLISGEAVTYLSRYCFQLLGVTSNNSLKRIKAEESFGNTKVKINVNDWFSHREDISDQYIRLIETSQREITIINSYFFPGNKFLEKLFEAVKRGVKVKLILPSYSDWQVLVYASEYSFEKIIKNGVEIYRWDKSLLHGKLALFDRKYAMVGSFNLHYTSFKGNLEINIDLTSEDYLTRLSSEIDHDVISNCQRVNLDEFNSKKTLWLRFKRFVFYAFFIIVSKVSVSFIHRKEK